MYYNTLTEVDKNNHWVVAEDSIHLAGVAHHMVAVLHKVAVDTHNLVIVVLAEVDKIVVEVLVVDMTCMQY